MSEQQPHPRITEVPEMTPQQAEALDSRLEYESWISRMDEVLSPVRGAASGPEKRLLLNAIKANFDNIEIDPEAFPDDEIIRLRNEFNLEVQNLRKFS